MAALVRYLSDGQFTQLGLCRRWPLARCRAEMERKAALQSLMRLNGRFLIDATAEPEGRPGIMKNSPKTAYSSELKSES